MRFSNIVAMALAGLLLVHRASAHDVITTKLTYSRDIARIFAKRCVTCHGAGTSIPLTSYQETRPWAVDIKEQVLRRQMPPWGAVKGFGNLSPDRGLTEEELLIIAAWVIGGAPEGNPAALPRTSPIKELAMPPLHDAIIVKQSHRLDAAILLAGIRPEPPAELATARIVAILPDGRKVPLVWLFHFDPKWKQIFRFGQPLSLPLGSLIESDVALQFALETP